MKRKVIALTGGIGSGKSEVAKILRQDYGFDVVDCDAISRKVSVDDDLLLRVRKLLGEESVQSGKLNRTFVRERVFADTELYRAYSNLFWDKIQALMDKEIQTLGGIVFVEIPVLDAFSYDWWEIWLVQSSDYNRILRATLRDGVSAQNVQNIMSKQKICANYTQKICNDGSLDDLKAQVKNALKKNKLI